MNLFTKQNTGTLRQHFDILSRVTWEMVGCGDENVRSKTEQDLMCSNKTFLPKNGVSRDGKIPDR